MTYFQIKKEQRNGETNYLEGGNGNESYYSKWHIVFNGMLKIAPMALDLVSVQVQSHWIKTRVYFL